MPETTITPGAPSWSDSPGLEALERRVGQLEEALASLCDTEAMEERVREKVVRELKAEGLTSATARNGAAAVRDSAGFSDAFSEASETGKDKPLAKLGRSLLRDIWWDVKTLYRMIRDPRYRISTVAKVVPLLALIYVTLWAMVSGWLPFWPPGIPLVSYLDDVLVIYLGLKVLGRELRRYKQATSNE